MEMGAIWKGDKKRTPDRDKKNEDIGGSKLELFDSDEDSGEEQTQSLRKRGGTNKK